MSNLSSHTGQSQWTCTKQWTNQNSKQIHVASSQARENAYEHVAIGFGWSSDWLRKWHEFFLPTTELSKANPKKTGTTFDTRLKTALTGYRIQLNDTADINFCLPLSSGGLYLKDKFVKTTACSKLWFVGSIIKVVGVSSFWVKKMAELSFVWVHSLLLTRALNYANSPYWYPYILLFTS